MSLLDRILDPVDRFGQDARFAWRSVKRSPGFTMLIIVTLSLGIGVNSATFTVLDRIYLRPPLGVADPSHVHRIWIRHSKLEGEPRYSPSMTYPMYRAVREAWGDTSRLALTAQMTDYRMGGTRRGARVDALFATANYWSVLGLRPQLGRFFDASEDRPGSGAAVTVLSDHLWRSQFSADPTILGKSILLDTEHYTVIGVAPAGFTGDNLRPVDAWMPLASYPQPTFLPEPVLSSNGYAVFLPLVLAKPNDDLTAFERRATQDIRNFNRSLPQKGDTLMSVATGPINWARGPGEQSQGDLISTRLSAVALIVLIIAAANVVNLLLARATYRRRELAVRLALGIGRWRLVRLLTVETLLLALLAAAVSLWTAWWGGNVLRALVLPDVRFLDAPVDMRVVVFTLAIAIIAGAIAGVVPAWQASHPDLTRALKEGVREGAFRRSRLRAALLVTQTALSVALLAGAALFVESLRNVRSLDIGYDAPRTLVGSVDFDPGQAPPAALEATQVASVASRLAAMPGVEAVARTQQVPMQGYSYTRVLIGTDSVLPVKHSYPVLNVVTHSFFAATGLRLLRGHDFADEPGAAPEVVINEAMAQQLFQHKDPVGTCLRFDGPAGTCYVISGIVQTARRSDITEEPTPQYYLPMSNLPKSMIDQWSHGSVLVARVRPDAAPRVQAAMTQLLVRELPNAYPSVQLLTDVLDPQYRPWRVGATLFSGLSILALLVAIVGIYSTVSYGVGMRTHEFGVRIALGARLGDILRLVLGEGLRTVLIGVGAGVGLAIVSGRLIASLLYGVSPSNPFVMAAVSAALLLVAAAATFVPAWRAGRVDPMIALRSE
jgi:predicted permease